MTTNADIAARNELARQLGAAARLEQAVMCQYLYAAFSMKRSHVEGGVSYEQLEHMRRWEADIMRVARQEMEHLGLVLNLRTAIGEAPSFELPPFPFEDVINGIPVAYSLAPFSEAALMGFALIEMPENLPPRSRYYAFLQERINGFCPASVDAVARLYGQIRELFERLPESMLFIGPPSAQFNTHDIFPGVIRGLTLSSKAAYQFEMSKVTDRESALAVIDQITTEGEGGHNEGGPGSHFAAFMDILMDLSDLRARDPGFEPARPVISNPTLPAPDGDSESGSASVVSDPIAKDALALFEAGYETMLLMLSRFFAFPQNDREEMAALQQAVFFPMMTTIIRPLGEILTMLPSGPPGSPRAGASFRSPGSVELAPHKWAAFHLLRMRYEQMKGMAADLVEKIETLPDDVPKDLIHERLSFLYEQIYRSHMNLRVNYEKTPDGL